MSVQKTKVDSRCGLTLLLMLRPRIPPWLKLDGFGVLYAEGSQFRLVEAGTSRGWPCWKLARREEGRQGCYTLRGHE